jgi:hypothetical protein
MWNISLDDDSNKGMGDVFDPYTSPNDPIWWSHHANLGIICFSNVANGHLLFLLFALLTDRLWYEWREKVGYDRITEEDNFGGFYIAPVSNPQVHTCRLLATCQIFEHDDCCAAAWT